MLFANMLVTVAAIIGIFSASAVLSQENETTYAAKFNNVDLEEIIGNDRLMQNYVDCVLEKGKCTPEGEELKKNIVDALENGCTKCTDEHKEGIRKVVLHLTANKKDWWQELVAKYDPEGKYKEKYADLISQENIDL